MFVLCIFLYLSAFAEIIFDICVHCSAPLHSYTYDDITAIARMSTLQAR